MNKTLESLLRDDITEAIINAYRKSDFSGWTTKRHEEAQKELRDRYLSITRMGAGSPTGVMELSDLLYGLEEFHRLAARGVSLAELQDYKIPEIWPTPEEVLVACFSKKDAENVRQADRIRADHYAQKHARAKINVA